MEKKPKRTKKEKKEGKKTQSSSEDEEKGGYYCFTFPSGDESASGSPSATDIDNDPRETERKQLEEEYRAKLLNWGAGFDEGEEVNEIAPVKIKGGSGIWRSEEEKEEFNEYLARLLEKDDLEKLRKQEEEIRRLKDEIARYKNESDGVATKGDKKKVKRKGKEKEKAKEKIEEKALNGRRSNSHSRSSSASSDSSIEKDESEVQLTERERALIEYKRAIAEKYARIRMDVKDHRSQMILGYYSDRLSRRLGTSHQNEGGNVEGKKSPNSSSPSPELPPLKLGRIPGKGGSEVVRSNNITALKSEVSPKHSSLRDRRNLMRSRHKSMQPEVGGLDAMYIVSHPPASPYRRGRANTTTIVSISPRDAPGSEPVRSVPISFQEKKEEEKRYCVVIGDRFAGKTSLLDAVCVPRTSREKYDKDLRKSMKGSWFKRGNSLKKSSSTSIRKKQHSIRFEATDGKMRTLVFYDISESSPDAEEQRRNAYGNADICLICYPVDDETAYERLREKWIPEVQSIDPPLPIVLVGTRADMRMNGVERLTRSPSQEKRGKGRRNGKEKEKEKEKEREKEKEKEKGDEEEGEDFRGLLLSKELNLSGYVECSILFRKTLDRFIMYISDLIAENENVVAFTSLTNSGNSSKGEGE